MNGADPANHAYWLASRALGVVALILVSLSVILGLALSGRAVRYPGAPAWVKHLHEALSLTGLGAILGHGVVLVGDRYLQPGLAGIALPFAIASQPIWTGLGIVAGWLAAILGLSFYIRRWIGVVVWRWLHRWTLLVYVLIVAHTIGSGSDRGSWWLIAILIASGVPILILATHRWFPPAGAEPRAVVSAEPQP